MSRHGNAYNLSAMRSWGVKAFPLSLLVLLVAGSIMGQTTTPTLEQPKLSASAIQEQLSVAQALIKSGKFKEAAAMFQNIISTSDAATHATPDNQTQLHAPPEAHAGLVLSLLKLDDVAGAEEASGMGIRLYPQSTITQTARGDVRFRSGAIGEAEQLYRSAIQLDAKNARAWLGMGRVDSVLSRRDKVAEDFSRAHELAPDDGDVLYYWALWQPYPANVNGLEKHLAEFRDDQERERHVREHIAFIKALAGRKVWIQVHDVAHSEMRLQPVIARLQDGPRGYALTVRLNDRVTANLMVDTAATGLVISRKLAEKAGAAKLSEHSLEGVGSAGASAGFAALLEKVTVGDFEFHDCTVVVSPGMSPDFDGLIGTDVFENYLVTVDFPERKLRLSRQHAAPRAITVEGGDPLQFYRLGHILLMPTTVGDTTHGLFVLDTGSSTNTISPALARQVSIVRDSNTPVNGMSGRVKNVYSTDHTTLQFGRFQQPHENLVTFDVPELSKDLGVEVSGFIGFATLKNMKLVIDYQSGSVDFEYKP